MILLWFAIQSSNSKIDDLTRFGFLNVPMLSREFAWVPGMPGMSARYLSRSSLNVSTFVFFPSSSQSSSHPSRSRIF